jgi:hypothetical protein
LITLITSLIGLGSALIIFVLIRNDQLHGSHGIAWVVAGLSMAMLGLAPGIFDQIANSMGVTYPPALAFTMALVVVAIKLLVDDIERSRLKVRQNRLVQRIAILENEVRKANKPSTPTVSEAE